MKVIVTPHLGIELTQRCNLNCSHCFRGEARNLNISSNIIEKIFDEVKLVQTLNLSGGEVFLAYEQLKMLLEIAQKKEVTIQRCSMIINGTIYDERIYDLLDKYFKDRYQIAISDDDFHDKSIRRIYGKNQKKSEKSDLYPLSTNDVEHNMKKHLFNKHCIGFRRVSNRLINNGRAVNIQTPHKEFEAMGYYYNLNPKALLVGPMIFVGADGYISDINSDIDKREEQSLGNINEKNISDLVLDGGVEVKYSNINEFLSQMRKREIDFGMHQGDHLIFKNGKMEHIEYKKDEAYYKALDGVEDFCHRAFEAIEKGKLEEFLEKDEYMKLYPSDLSQIDHKSIKSMENELER